MLVLASRSSPWRVCVPSLTLPPPPSGASRHACKMGLEGIVSKRKDSTYRSGRSPDWHKMKNPNAPGSETGSRGRLGSIMNYRTHFAHHAPRPRRRGDRVTQQMSGEQTREEQDEYA